jgi:hypothetical protein
VVAAADSVTVAARATLWLFAPATGTLLDPARVQKVFKRVLKTAGLPLHFSPRCLRHTYASLLLQQGESPAYVQRQLGHASIRLTVDMYGKWLPTGNKAAVDGLDSASGSKVVAKQAGGPEAAPHVPDSSSAPWVIRTPDLLIRSQTLYPTELRAREVTCISQAPDARKQRPRRRACAVRSARGRRARSGDGATR